MRQVLVLRFFRTLFRLDYKKFVHIVLGNSMIQSLLPKEKILLEECGLIDNDLSDLIEQTDIQGIKLLLQTKTDNHHHHKLIGELYDSR